MVSKFVVHQPLSHAVRVSLACRGVRGMQSQLGIEALLESSEHRMHQKFATVLLLDSLSFFTRINPTFC